MNNLRKLPRLLVWVLFVIVAFLFFFPAINRTFASDDFYVVKRLADGVFWIKDFFRPLSDLTLYLNYLLCGFDPKGYYIVNIILHATNAFLLYNFCRQFTWTDDLLKRDLHAWIAAFLFLIYPYHNESIVWAIGRASLVGDSFGFLALVVLTSQIKYPWKIVLVCAFNFIGLASYESLFVLPLIVTVLLLQKIEARKLLLHWLIPMAATIVLHVFIRRAIAGAVLGAYGKGFFGHGISMYFGNMFRTAARLLIPPIENLFVFAALFMTVVVLISFVVIRFLRSTQSRDARLYAFKILLSLIAASLIPFAFGVSTKTSESDRLLYFPSFFLMALISLLCVQLLNAMQLRIYVVAISIYFVVFLQLNNLNWIKASQITSNVLQEIREVHHGKEKLYMVNLPDEYNGAYIFRDGIFDAMLMNKLDTTGIVLVNHLKRSDMLRTPSMIIVDSQKNGAFIAPHVFVSSQNDHGSTTADTIYLKLISTDHLLYWNKKSFVQFQ